MLLKECNRILVMRTDRIGDVVLTTPVLKSLRGAYQNAFIVVCVSKANVDLVRGNPYIDRVIYDDRRGEYRGILGFLNFARMIRRWNFDTVFIFHNKRRYNLVCFLAGVARRIGYRNGKFSALLTHPFKDKRHLGEKHESEYCQDLLKSVGVDHPNAEPFVPSHKEAEAWALDWLKSNHVLPDELVAIHPGASDKTRLWPAVNYAKTVDALSRLGLKSVLVGGRETAEIGAEIKRLSGSNVLDLTGGSDLAQTASILRRCRMMVSCDSGPIHIGAGVGIWTICLFPRSQAGINPTRWRPLGPRAIVLVNKAGEEIILDKKGGIQSGKLDSITVEDVMGAVEHILAQDSQSLFHW